MLNQNKNMRHEQDYKHSTLSKDMSEQNVKA